MRIELDYSLREFPIVISRKLVKKLTVTDRRIVFQDRASAKVFALSFLKRQFEHWGGFEAVSRYRIFANILKYGLEKKIIAMDDFWQNDAFVLKKLKSAKDVKIKHSLQILENRSLNKIPKSKIVAHKKFRFVDPLFIQNKKLERLSKVDTNFNKELERSRKLNRQGIIVPLV